jgi:TolA-binding protein
MRFAVPADFSCVSTLASRGCPGQLVFLLALSLAGDVGCMTAFQARKVKTEIAEVQARLTTRPDADRGREIAEVTRALEDAEARWAKSDSDSAEATTKMEAEVATLDARSNQLADTMRLGHQARAETTDRFERRLAALEKSDAEIADEIGLSLPDDKDELWRQATALVESGERERGRRYCQAFIDRFPQDPRASQAYLAIGRSYVEEARYSNAVASYQRLLSLYPTAPEAPQAMWQLSRAFEELSFCADARALLRTLVGRYPKSREAIDATKQLRARKEPARECVS